ncbi:TolC family protein [Comamonas sp. JNW]|uniref:TolC family protein n=1 Tax=Comamonas sp. JNW TaxID=2170731 RepID=UPI001FAEA65A|nr:TolC family protein [Comamonas sp. JNW]
MKPLFCKTLLALAPAALLAGCMTPAQPPLNPDTPAQWRQAGGSAPHAHAVKAADLSAWWTLLGDPALDKLVEQALAQNLDFAQAQGRLEAQRILLGTATAAYKPAFSAGVRTLQDVAALDSYFHASLDMGWNLGLFGAYESSALDGQAQLLDAQAQLQAARVQLVAHVVQRYLDICVAQQQRFVLDQQLQLDARRLQLQQVRVQQRMGSAEQVQQAHLELNRSRAQEADLLQHQARAAHALAALLGRSEPEAAWLATSSTPHIPSATALRLQVLPAELLRSRPAILAAEAAVQRAAAAAGLSNSALYPRFALGGSLLYSYNLTQNRRSSSNQVPSLGPVIDIPLFDWGRRRAQADADELEMNNAVKAYRQSVLDGVADVETALAGLAAQQQRQQSLDAQTPLLRSRAQQLQRRQQLGLASELDTLEPRRQLLLHASQQSVGQAAQALAWVALFQALGGAPLPPQTPPGTAGATP